MDILDIDDLQPYVDAIVAAPNPGNRLVLQLDPDDDASASPAEVMLAVHVAVIERLLGDPGEWDLAHFSIPQWRSVVAHLACTEWRPCVACATPVGFDSDGLEMSETLPGHYLWQHDDWDGESPCIRLDAHSLVLWVVPDIPGQSR